jgi:hypothetical protein
VPTTTADLVAVEQGMREAAELQLPACVMVALGAQQQQQQAWSASSSTDIRAYQVQRLWCRAARLVP